VKDRSELRLVSVARPQRAKTLRHALGAFLTALDINAEIAVDVLTAVGEALANVVEHAYDGESKRFPGEVELVAQAGNPPGTLCVDVFDRGRFIKRRARPGRGFGLRIVRAIARDVSIEASDVGTHVRMLFDGVSAPDSKTRPSGTLRTDFW
jgi:anti-sigma regulatory factor (Ser/Thr protein kinase)